MIYGEDSPLLSCRDVTKKFGGTVALRDFNFEIRPGEVVGLLGDNGAGKSTVVSMVSGVLQPSSGSIELEGHDITHKNAEAVRSAGIETIFQDLALCDNLDAASNIFMGREVRRRILGVLPVVDRNMMNHEAETVLDRLDIHLPDLQRPVKDMSGGQRQAIAIARAVYWNARLLLMDEPTAALGVPEQRKVLDIIEQLSGEGVAILLISHNMDDVFEACDRLLVLRRGANVFESSTSETSTSEVVSAMMGSS